MKFCQFVFFTGILLGVTSCLSEDEGPQPLADYTYLYWTGLNERRISRAAYLDGEWQQSEVVYEGLKGVGGPTGLAVDVFGGILYWADFENRQILRGAWDGSANPEVLYTAPWSGYGPLEVVLDKKTDRLYWTQPFEHLVLTAPVDGSGPVDTLFAAADGVNGAWGISLESEYLYWIEYGDNELWRAHIDNDSEAELLYAGGSGFLNPYGIAVSEATGELFITDNALPGAAYTDRILKGSTDGQLPLQTLYDEADGVDNAYAVVVDEQTGHLYWLNQLNDGSIYRGDIYGGPTEALITGVEVGQGLCVVHVQQPL